MNNFSSLIENSKQAVRYWWLLLIIGIALFAVGLKCESVLKMRILQDFFMHLERNC